MSRSREEVQGELELLRRQLADLTARLSALQENVAGAPGGAENGSPAAGVAAAVTPAGSAAPKAAAAGDEDLPEDIVLAIAASVAAYLGERVKVRQIRLISSPAWAQQGRVSIQASHRLDR